MIGLFALAFSIVSLTTATATTTKPFSKCFSQSSPNDWHVGRILPGQMENRKTIKG